MSSHSRGDDGAVSAAVDRTRRVVTAVGGLLPGDSTGGEAVLRSTRVVPFWAAVTLPFLLLA